MKNIHGLPLVACALVACSSTDGSGIGQGWGHPSPALGCSSTVAQQPNTWTIGVASQTPLVFFGSACSWESGSVTLQIDQGELFYRGTFYGNDGPSMDEFDDLVVVTTPGKHQLTLNKEGSVATLSIIASAAGAPTPLYVTTPVTDVTAGDTLPNIQVNYWSPDAASPKDDCLMTATLVGDSNAHLTGVTGVETTNRQAVFSALTVSAPASQVTLQFACNGNTVQTVPFTVHAPTWSNAARVARGAAPPGGSGTTWFSSGTELFASPDGGTTLNALPATPVAYASVVEDPFDANHLMALGLSGSVGAGAPVYNSNDAGQTWQGVNAGALVSDHALFFSPKNAHHVFLMAPEYGLWGSTDDGNTWTVILKGIIDARVGRDGTLYGMSTQTLFRSQDEGTTWSILNIDLAGSSDGWPVAIPELSIPTFAALATDPSDPNTLYAMLSASRDLFYVSHNSGETWAHGSAEGLSPYVGGAALSACSGGGQTVLYASAYVDVLNAYAMLASVDQGTSWTLANWGYTDLGVQQPFGIVCAPQDSKHVFVEWSDGGAGSSTGGF